jgi:ABC-type multidrug transport system ATPase subunit
VRDLTFHVQQGGLYALLGINGAGKSSAPDVIGGRRRATSGTVRVFGTNSLGRPTVSPRSRRPAPGSALLSIGLVHLTLAIGAALTPPP